MFFPETECSELSMSPVAGLQYEQRSRQVGSVVTFWCEEGLSLAANHSQLVCGPQGQWLGVVPNGTGGSICSHLYLLFSNHIKSSRSQNMIYLQSLFVNQIRN